VAVLHNYPLDKIQSHLGSPSKGYVSHPAKSCVALQSATISNLLLCNSLWVHLTPVMAGYSQGTVDVVQMGPWLMYIDMDLVNSDKSLVIELDRYNTLEVGSWATKS